MGLGTTIRARDLRFEYPDGTRVFEGVSLRLAPGDFLTLLAPNGGGKSTLLQLMMGLLEPTGGEVTLGGQPVTSIPDERRFRKLGFVFQNPDDQLFGATIREDVCFGPRNLDLEEPEVKQRMEQALRDVDLAVDPDKPIHRLSFGQKKRVAIAGCLAMGADVLLLDEPTAELDPLAQVRVYRLLRRLNRDGGKTVLHATHNVDLIDSPEQEVGVLSSAEELRRMKARQLFEETELLRKASLRPPLGLLARRWIGEAGSLSDEDAYRLLDRYVD